MNRIILLTISLVLFSFSVKTEAETYLTVDQLPNPVNYLPAPIDTSSQRFAGDWLRYNWGKSMRSGDRGSQVRREASMSLYMLCNEFTGAFGVKISKTNTPELYTLLSKAMYDAKNAVSKVKEHYKRKCPFTQFNESSIVGGTTDATIESQGSYASAHASIGWAMALILAEINVDRQDTILSRGYQMGEDRVIGGFHYQTDVDAGREVATGAVARLHADSAFSAQLAKAKTEYVALITGITTTTISSEPSDKYYNLEGVEVTKPRNGIFLRDGEKVILK